MSIVCKTSDGFLISYEVFTKKIYRNVSDGDCARNLEFKRELFNIQSPFVNSYKADSRKRKRSVTKKENTSVLSKEIKNICDRAVMMLEEFQKQGYLNNTSSEICDKNVEARRIADDFYQQSARWQGKCFHGANNTDKAIIKKMEDENYVFPKGCRFFNYDVRDIQLKLDMLKSEYHLILLDPPWWNKYIRRKKAKCEKGSYQMMYSEELKNIPISSLLAPGSLIAVWCTNSPSHLNTLIKEIFPSWNVKYVGKWFWVKITQNGEPVCSFAEPPSKQPFEQIIFGCNLNGIREYPLPEDGKVIVSIPSAVHSHKPPLSELLSPYLGPAPQCLELFARYLLPDWTSWGYEVLKLQHMCLYQDSVPEDS